jgi:hypothetical protein
MTGAWSLLLVLAMLLQVGSSSAEFARPALGQLRRGELFAADDQARVASALRAAGLQPGDRVASGNRGLNAYWARLARLEIVAEVSGYDGTTILDEDADARAATAQLLLNQDVRAVVAYGWPSSTGDPAWQLVEGTNYFYLLRNQTLTAG